jgi:hypothetical protein
MSNFDTMMNLPRPPSPEEKHHYESAGEFVQRVAAYLTFWLDSKVLSGASSGKRWVLAATLSSGATIILHSLAADGHSLIRLEGELPDGTPCLLFAHQHSVQLLAYHVPRKPEEPAKREIGFHTGLKEIKIEQ